MSRKITRKRKGKSRRTLRRNRKQKGGDNHNSNNPQTVDENSELSQVMASLPSNKIFPRNSEIDNKLLQAFKNSGIDTAWRTLVTKKETSKESEAILNRVKEEHGSRYSTPLQSNALMLYLLLVSRSWMISFVKKHKGGYVSARDFFKEKYLPADVTDSYLVGEVEQFLYTITYPDSPEASSNKLMEHIWDNPDLVLSVSSYVFGLAPINQNDTRVEDGFFNTPQSRYVPTADEENNEQFRSIVRNLRFDGGRKKRKSRNKSKKTSKKKTLKMKRKNHNKYLKK